MQIMEEFIGTINKIEEKKFVDSVLLSPVTFVSFNQIQTNLYQIISMWNLEQVGKIKLNPP